MAREIEFLEGGLKLRGSPLWFDARRKTDLAFISHAHADHIGRHRRVVATEATLALLRLRLGPRAVFDALPVPYRRPVTIGDLTLELFSAGHVLGSAQVRVVTRSGARVVYTGDLCPFREPFTAEPAEIAPCDTLVIEATYGHPRYVFPPREEVLAQARAWVDRVLSRGETPVVVGYALGKAQEAMGWLGGAGYRVRVHPLAWAVAEVYARQGVAFPNCSVLDVAAGEVPAPGEVVVAPPSAGLRLPRARTAMLTGWALDGRAHGRSDAAFALSDHADFPTLVRYVAATFASRVYTVFGHAEDLARELRRRGIRAEALRESRQLELAL